MKHVFKIRIILLSQSNNTFIENCYNKRTSLSRRAKWRLTYVANTLGSECKQMVLWGTTRLINDSAIAEAALLDIKYTIMLSAIETQIHFPEKFLYVIFQSSP